MMEKKTLWKALGIFFGVMVLFTLLSRAVYQQGTAVVQTASPMGGTINHTVRLQGKTTQKQALAVTTLPGLRIGAVLVSEGEQVKAGDVLFFLDMDYLEEKITQQSQEVRKQQFSVQDAWSQSNAQARQRANAKNQAEENYNAAVFSAEQKRNQARTALEQAQKQLDDFYAGVSGDSEKKQALEAAVREAEAGRTAAQGALDALMQERQTAIDQAIAQADTGEAPLTQEERAAIEAQIEANYAPTLAEAQTALTQAQAAEEQAKQALANFTPGEQHSEQELKDALALAQSNLEQAQAQLEDTLRTYGQALETASLPESTGSGAQIGQITYEQLRAQLEKLEALRDSGG